MEKIIVHLEGEISHPYKNYQTTVLFSYDRKQHVYHIQTIYGDDMFDCQNEILSVNYYPSITIEDAVSYFIMDMDKEYYGFDRYNIVEQQTIISSLSTYVNPERVISSLRFYRFDEIKAIFKESFNYLMGWLDK